jgi:ABC-type glycerol-3-phosphate transport system permease component
MYTIGQFSTDFQLLYSRLLISVLPMMIIYLFFRHWFIQCTGGSGSRRDTGVSLCQ